MASISGCIAAVSGVRAAVARWCEVLPVGRPQAGVSRPRPSAHPASRQTQRAPFPPLPAMQPSPLRIIGACTYRRFLSLCRPALARAQCSVARFALRRALHYRDFVVALSIEGVLGACGRILGSWCRCTALLELTREPQFATATRLRPRPLVNGHVHAESVQGNGLRQLCHVTSPLRFTHEIIAESRSN